MRFSDFPFLRYVAFLIFGVFLGRTSWVPSMAITATLLAAFWLAYVYLVIYKTEWNQRALLAYIQLVFLGMFAFHVNEFLTKKDKVIIANPYIAEVLQFDQEKPGSRENLLVVKRKKEEGGWVSSEGKVLVYHRQQFGLKPGQLVFVEKSPETIPAPSGPNEFDYSAFLEKKGILNRQFIDKELTVLDSAGAGSPVFWMEYIRESLSGLIREKVPDLKNQKIALALFLGQKQFLDRDTKKAYSEAGVMHVLAVSGLHIGILVGVLLLLIKPLRLGGKQRKTFLLGVVTVIWMYAFLTGLSPSVVRASVMFSLITLGQIRERKPSIYNVLAFSAMLMIVIDPEVIFEIGFQLSYLAVLGIVVIQPLILRWWLPPNMFLEYCWQLLTVSVAAQLATFPLSVWYFHSFPSYFLIANLLIIPLTFLLMQIGIPFLILSWIPVLSDVLGWILNLLLMVQDWLLGLIRLLPGGNMNELTIYIPTMLSIWGLLLIWGLWEFVPKKRLVQLTAAFVFFWAGNRFYEEWKRPGAELVVYRAEKGWMLDFWNGEKVYSWNEGLSMEDVDFLVKPNRIANQWNTTPIVLTAFEKDGKRLFFPFPEIEMDRFNQRLYVRSDKPKTMQVWEKGRWVSDGSTDSVDFSSSSIRILF